jgi:hypothetical protein
VCVTASSWIWFSCTGSTKRSIAAASPAPPCSRSHPRRYPRIGKLLSFSRARLEAVPQVPYRVHVLVPALLLLQRRLILRTRTSIVREEPTPPRPPAPPWPAPPGPPAPQDDAPPTPPTARTPSASRRTPPPSPAPRSFRCPKGGPQPPEDPAAPPKEEEEEGALLSRLASILATSSFMPKGLVDVVGPGLAKLLTSSSSSWSLAVATTTIFRSSRGVPWQTLMPDAPGAWGRGG